MKLAKTKTPKFHSTIHGLINDKVSFVSLGLGEPELETPSRIKDAAYKALQEGHTRYSNPFGLEKLREKISEKLQTENKINSKKENIIVTPGGKNALFISLMGLLNDGDEIINFTPCYVSNIPQLNLASRNIVIKNIDLIYPEFRIDRNLLEQNINEKTRVILINFPNNPTGSILSKDDAEYLVQLVKGRNIKIISDEVYERYVFDDENISIGSFKEIEDQVITINSFSKSHFMTGWRIGYLNANINLIQELSKINLHINTNTAAFIQKAALSALENENIELSEYLNNIKERRKIFSEIISQVIPNYKIPSGGLFTFLNISETNLNSDEFAANLLKEEKVAIVPGINFSESHDDYCRISFACKEEEFEKGVIGIKKFIERR